MPVALCGSLCVRLGPGALVLTLVRMEKKTRCSTRAGRGIATAEIVLNSGLPSWREIMSSSGCRITWGFVARGREGLSE